MFARGEVVALLSHKAYNISKHELVSVQHTFNSYPFSPLIYKYHWLPQCSIGCGAEA
jgi:hypothetical protein